MNFISSALSFLFRRSRKPTQHGIVSPVREKTVRIYSIEQPSEDRVKRSLSTKNGKDIVYLKVVNYNNKGTSSVSSVPLWEIKAQYQKIE
jgi:DNA-dependent RNA polymerase auxiliary subunit epsilon